MGLFLCAYALAVVFGSHAEAGTHVLTEEGEAGEIEFGRDVFDGLGGVLHEVFDVFHDVFVDDLRWGLACYVLADGGQVFGGDAELFGVVGDESLLGV